MLGRTVATALLRLATGAAALGSGAVAWTWWRIERAGRERPVPAGDVLVVFGAQATASGPSPELAARLRCAQRLHATGRASRIVCSGGVTPTHSEADVMAATLTGWGVPAAAVSVDTHGQTTRQTVANLSAYAGQRLLAVSSAYHMHRIATEARRQGLVLVCCPVRDTPIMRRRRAYRRQMAYEIVAAWWYTLTAAGCA